MTQTSPFSLIIDDSLTTIMKNNNSDKHSLHPSSSPSSYGSLDNQIPSTEQPQPSPILRINRPTINLPEFNSKFSVNCHPNGESSLTSNPTGSSFNDPQRPTGNNGNNSSKSKRLVKKVSRNICSKNFWKETLFQWIPITKWLFVDYDIKRDITADFLVGITVAIFQVPQSMGYCLIANVPPVHGLYTAFFPPLVYAILGTSRHSAVGAFALVSGVMTGHLVNTVTEEQLRGLTVQISDTALDALHVSIAVSAAVSMGLLMLLFGVLRLGFVSIYLSPQSISGFCCAASIYVFTSQLRHLTGVDYPLRSGFLAVPYAYYDFFERFKEIHVLTGIISVVCIIVLAFFKVYLNVKLMAWQKKVSRNWNPLPFPIELIVVIVATVVSNCINLSSVYGVEVVGEIKQGMPAFVAPDWTMVSTVFLRSIPLAVVGYAISLSVARLFGSKHGYSVDADQELTALGCSNLIGSFFGCLPSAASLPRSAIQESSGGKTQVVSLVNCAALLVVILAVGSLLEALPNCVLASIISVALIGLITQGKDFFRLWAISRLDGLQFAVSFWAVILLDVDIGLYVGTCFSLLVLIFRSSRPKTYLLGSNDYYAEDIFVPTKIYGKSPHFGDANRKLSTCSQRRKKEKTVVSEKKGVKVYQFCGPLHFSSKDFFRRDLLKHCVVESKYSAKTKHVVVDCSMISYIDSAGLDAMKLVVSQDLKSQGMTASLASPAPHVVNIMMKDKTFFTDVLRPEDLFVSVYDAVTHAQEVQQQNLNSSSDTDHNGNAGVIVQVEANNHGKEPSTSTSNEKKR